jgi:DNA-directed RNA polymerase subunit RPC12/RpoP
MRVKYLGESDPVALLNGKIYNVLSVEKDWYRIVDEAGEDCLYPPEAFEIVNSTRMVTCHDCGKRLSGAGVTVVSANGERRQVCPYCARFYKD